LFTGLYPESHQCHAIAARLPAASSTLPEILQQAGYRTGVFAENSFVSRLFGYGRGVERMVCAEPDVPAQTVLGHLLQQVVARVPALTLVEETARLVNVFDPQQRGKGREGLDLPDAFSTWLDEIGEDPYFAYVHFMKPHAPYIAPLPFDGRFGEPSGEGTDSPVVPPHVNGLAPFAHAHQPSAEDHRALVANYDERILFGDSLLERIVDDLKRRGRLERTAIVVIADHGEEFGENGLWDHGHSLQEGVLHVPFVLRYPARVPAGGRVSAPVRLLDLGPTVLDLAGLPSSAQFDGQSVLSLLEPEAEPPRPVLSQVRHGPDFWSNALRVEGLKIVDTREGAEAATRLFELAADPLEQDDLAPRRPALLERLQEDLDLAVEAAGLKRQDTQTMIVDPETLERLRALGYVQ
jgi:arylsulfatase A-like enzyme